MAILNNSAPLKLWCGVVRSAEKANNVRLDLPVENYLVELLDRFSKKPELVDHVVAINYMQAENETGSARLFQLQDVGDHCLIFTGLFPNLANERHVKLSYFVDVGRSAYSSVSQDVNDLFTHLSSQFVTLMDVLQSIRADNRLLPLEAYEQWRELGSRRAKKILDSYTDYQ